LKIPVISHPSASLPVDSLSMADTNNISAVADAGVILELNWLRNDLNDSVTIWIGATSRNTQGFYFENGVVFRF
jgi:hypothetical protein